MQQTIRMIAIVACMAFAAGCSQESPQASPLAAPATGDTQAAAETAAENGAEANAAPEEAVATMGGGAGTRACMIAGEFEILGRKIRSRDCLQAGSDIPEASHRELCEGLANTSAQIGGGKAGTLEYMDACPSPNQGSCKGIFGQPTMHAFYYERTEDDLATLPGSCAMGGGTWQG